MIQIVKKFVTPNDKFQQVESGDPRFGRFLGRKFVRIDQVVHELRCWICGKWYSYSSKDIDALTAKGMWDFRKRRPKHCGSSHCQEWNRRHEAFQVQTRKQSNQYYEELFMKLKRKKLVA